MSRKTLISIITGAAVFVIAMLLPYLGDKNFLWLTVSLLGESGTLYFISPAAMPLVLLLWFCAIYGLSNGYTAKKAAVTSDRYAKIGTVIGIINVVLLGFLSVLWPLIIWLIFGHPTTLY